MSFPSPKLNDLLRDPIFSVTIDGQEAGCSLPEVLSHLGSGRELQFLNLQLHWQHPWHAFLTQLGALALVRGGLSSLSESPENWRKALLLLAGGSRTAWCLVVGDLSQPAFMQPPVPEGRLGALLRKGAEDEEGTISSPDGLDIVLTPKNVDLKAGRMAHPREEHWAYVLVAKQTFSHFWGRGKYGSARTPWSRVCVAFYRDRSWSARFCQDVDIWQKEREALLESMSDYGDMLLWVPPWDGTSQLEVGNLDPFFLDCARRIRLATSAGSILAYQGSSKGYHVGAKTAPMSSVLDIWYPLHEQDQRPLSGGERSFYYENLADILFSPSSGWKWASKRHAGKSAKFVFIHSISNKEGQIEGFTHRIIPLPTLPEKDLSNLLPSMVACAKSASGSLYGALKTLEIETSPWMIRFDARIEDRFFFELASATEVDSAQRRWEEYVLSVTKELFEDAIRLRDTSIARRAMADLQLENGLIRAGLLSVEGVENV
jgi:CRISPR system Cascade subunit CasA